jgi:gamma-glutamyltranspeptidase / glutathione hydrolase
VTDRPLQSVQRITKSEAVSENGMVTAMHPLAAEAGVAILRRGGNAVDAAIAAALASGVVEPFMSGIGGTLYALVYDTSTGVTRSFDGTAVAPSETREDMYELAALEDPRVGVYGWRATRDDESETGFRSIAVPGAIAALDELHRAHATLSWEELAAPAVRLAEEGFSIDEHFFAQRALSRPRLNSFAETVDVFCRTEALDERLIQPALARTLRRIGSEGPSSFYEGETAEEMVSFVRAHGGVLSLDDLGSYRAQVGAPLLSGYRGRRIETLGGPSGGPTLALALAILEGFDFEGRTWDPVSRVHVVAETLRIAFQDRFRFLADPATESVPLDGLVSPRYAAVRRRWIEADGMRVPEIGDGDPWSFCEAGAQAAGTSSEHPGQHTTHLNAADRDGNLVALTATLGNRFGSGVTVPSLGVVLNDGMMWFDPEPGRLNSIRPGKRALHAAAPSLVFQGSRPILAVGSPGARKIMSSVLQVLLYFLDDRMGIQAAIEAPRIHTEAAPPLLVESHFAKAVADGLRVRGHDVLLKKEGLLSSWFGRPSGIHVDSEAGCFRGGMEPYRVGVALGY